MKSQISSIGIEKENDSHSNVLNNDDIELTMTAQSSTFSNAVIDTPEFKKDISMNKNEKNPNFQSSYFNKFNWLEYSISDDAVFCFPCRHFSLSSNFRGQTIGNAAYIDRGVKCWRNPLQSLTKHSRSENHLTSVERWNQYLAIQAKQNSIANLLKSSKVLEIENNRKHIYFLLKATLYLAKQGLAFRRNDESSLSKNKVDETKDSSKKEQLSFLIRFVDINFNIFEKALGYSHMKKSDATSLAQEIVKLIKENNLDINKCIAQCDDGASVMSGVYSGVQQKISEIVPHAVYIHCYAHRLNLCLVDCIQNVPLIVDFFDTIQNFYKYLMNSQTRYELFVEAQKNKNVKVIHLERLVDTRWYYWYTSLKKVRSRYTVIIEVLTFLTEHGDQTVRAIGLLKILSTFKFIMILEIMVSVLECIHCLSCELQNSNIILSKAMLLVKSSRNNILKLRCEESWLKFHQKATDIAICNGIKTQTHSEHEKRKQTLNKHLNDYFVLTTLGRARCKEKDVSSIKVELLYQVIDRIVAQLDERFSKNEQVFDIFNVFDYTNADFLNAECVAVNKFLDDYRGFQINSLSLPSEFSSIKATLELEMSQFKLELIFNIVLNLPFAFPETIKILFIMLTLPVTTASNERFFSSLKRKKNFLRTTIGDERLNDLMVLGVETEEAKQINLNDAVDDFAKMKDRRYPLY
ncbi:zinc finger MYM-type protein 1-like [Aphis craccivora]|uniref:Zinc finger MYM-type protein 1-like n=1 Tax=Aphis craccivora TaxID=307492 RepID=A0A6G0VVU6_APHCR|nr:zinc finger MYM-type protein 1-like [Aphis craccivora]